MFGPPALVCQPGRKDRESAMIDILMRTLPFFAIIGLGYAAGRIRFFSEEATAALTKVTSPLGKL